MLWVYPNSIIMLLMSILSIIHWLCLFLFVLFTVVHPLLKSMALFKKKKSFYFLRSSSRSGSFKIKKISLNPALSLKKTFSIQSVHKKQSSHPVAHKRQFSIQSAHKEQSSHTVAHKGQPSTQSACQKQLSHLIIHQKQFTLI